MLNRYHAFLLLIEEAAIKEYKFSTGEYKSLFYICYLKNQFKILEKILPHFSREIKCFLDEDIIYRAVKRGQIQILKVNYMNIFLFFSYQLFFIK